MTGPKMDWDDAYSNRDHIPVTFDYVRKLKNILCHNLNTCNKVKLRNESSYNGYTLSREESRQNSIQEPQ